jgi:transcriptional regulator with XRE-family HTH domain
MIFNKASFFALSSKKAVRLLSMPKIKEHRPSVFARRLRELRKARQLTQQELADALDLNPSTIGYYEAIAKNPRLATLERIAEFFDVSPDYLLSDKEEPKKRGPESRVDRIASELRSMSTNKQREACSMVEAVIRAYKK